MQTTNPLHFSLSENCLVLICLITFVILIIALGAVIFIAKKRIAGLRHDLGLCERALITVMTEMRSQEVYRFAEIGRGSAELVHDLANPVTALLCSLDRLEAEHGSIAVRSVRESVSYIEDCLASARVRLKDRDKIQTFCARSEVVRIIGFLEQKATRNNIGIKARLSEVKLQGQSSKFGQIVSNLVDNAIDSYEGAETDFKSIKVELKLGADRQVILLIEDNGIGVPLAAQEEVFRPFFSTKAGNKGTGLGLYISKRIIEDDFAGSLRMTSSPGVGTTFFAEFPQRQL